MSCTVMRDEVDDDEFGADEEETALLTSIAADIDEAASAAASSASSASSQTTAAAIAEISTFEDSSSNSSSSSSDDDAPRTKNPPIPARYAFIIPKSNKATPIMVRHGANKVPHVAYVLAPPQYSHDGDGDGSQGGDGWSVQIKWESRKKPDVVHCADCRAILEVSDNDSGGSDSEAPKNGRQIRAARRGGGRGTRRTSRKRVATDKFGFTSSGEEQAQTHPPFGPKKDADETGGNTLGGKAHRKGACQQTQDTADIVLLRSPAALHDAIRASRDRLFFIRTHNSLQLVKVDLTATQEHEVTQTHMVDGVYYVEFFAIYSKDVDVRLPWDESRWRIRWHNYKFGSDGEIEYDDKMSELSPQAQPDPDKYIAYADFVCLCDSDIFIAGPFDFDEPKLKGWRERIPPYIWQALVGALREKSQNELMPHLSAAVLDDMGGNASIKAAKSSSGARKADGASVSRSKRSRSTEENGTIPVAPRKSRRTEGASRANERDFHTSFEFVSGYRQSDPSGIGVVAKRRILPRSKFTDVYSRYFHGSPPESKCSERGNIIKAREGYFDLCPSHSQWINEARGEETPNIKFCMGHDQTLVWKVTKQIEAGEELLVEYGGYDGSAEGR